ncbi:GNAT family N-acetyltransferase [Roseibium sp.]|uniref:GNAT family N-acetyltransferase n=1 Tax=Roseibium sp. TaxID=1936156 RepID=UPI003A97DE58
MTQIAPTLIEDIRSASRTFVREHGFLDKTLAGTTLAPSAVHAIIEIGLAGELTSKQLAERLNLEKSTISRLVQSLEKRGELAVVANPSDRRSSTLRLTSQGTETLKSAAHYGRDMVANALPRLNGIAPADVAEVLTAYADALKARRTGQAVQQRHKEPEIVEGYQTGMIGDLAALHARTHGFIVGDGPQFESVVSTALAEFVPRLSRAKNNSWSVVKNQRVIASISIDGEGLGEENGRKLAHLRWFILSEELRGQGLGRTLLNKAIDHCDQHGFDEIRLWTVKGLDAARKLYEQNGFVLTSEYEGDQWGRKISEQTFSRFRPTR